MNGTYALILLIVAILILIFGPLVTIWAINTLFGLSIAYTFNTWLAVIILGSAMRANVNIKRS